MIVRKDKVARPDGASIHRLTFAPEGQSRGQLHLCHGMAEHSGRYERLAKSLTEAGWTVYASDHRGHGETAKPEDLGHLADEGGFGLVLGDLNALITEEKAAAPGLPFVLMGHSMGSFLAQELLFERSSDLAGAVLSGSNGKPTAIARAGRLVARAEKLRLGARGKSKVLSALSFEAFNKSFAPNRTEYDWLSRDPAEVDRYVADPLSGFPCTTATWIEVLDALDRIASPVLQATIRKDLPLYVITGTEDAANDRGAGVKRLLGAYQRAGLTHVTSRFYEGARHETLNETNRGEVTDDLVAWLERLLA